MSTNHHLIYLAGGVDKAPDLGLAWRLTFEELIESMDIGYRCVWPVGLREIAYETRTHVAQRLRKLTKENWEAQPRAVLMNDLRLMFQADIVLVNLDRYAGNGTLGELKIAQAAGIEVIVMANIYQPACDNKPTYLKAIPDVAKHLLERHKAQLKAERERRRR
jgi:hypothetical protein